MPVVVIALQHLKTYSRERMRVLLALASRGSGYFAISLPLLKVPHCV